MLDAAQKTLKECLYGFFLTDLAVVKNMNFYSHNLKVNFIIYNNFNFLFIFLFSKNKSYLS